MFLSWKLFHENTEAPAASSPRQNPRPQAYKPERCFARRSFVLSAAAFTDRRTHLRSSSPTLETLIWQYWTSSLKRKAKALKLTYMPGPTHQCQRLPGDQPKSWPDHCIAGHSTYLGLALCQRPFDSVLSRREHRRSWAMCLLFRHTLLSSGDKRTARPWDFLRRCKARSWCPSAHLHICKLASRDS